jgi:hypothetical protein
MATRHMHGLQRFGTPEQDLMMATWRGCGFTRGCRDSGHICFALVFLTGQALRHRGLVAAAKHTLLLSFERWLREGALPRKPIAISGS